MTAPKVSIILPFYNRAATLRRCIESVLAQTFKDWEVVAVDDGSSDGSRAVVEGFADPRICVLSHNQNRGVAAARNTALAAVRGEWVALLDSDDEWLAEKLEKQLAGLGRAIHCNLSSTNFYFVRDGRTRLLPGKVTGSLARTLHCECRFGFGSTLLIRRTVALELGGFDPELPRHEDWDWVLRAAEAGHTLAFVNQPLVWVHCVDRPRVEVFAPSTERFLLKHASELDRRGEHYHREVVAYHYMSVASMAYEQRKYRLGHRYLLRSLASGTRRNVLALAALPLGLVDWALRTRFIQWAAALRRGWTEIFPSTAARIE